MIFFNILASELLQLYYRCGNSIYNSEIIVYTIDTILIMEVHEHDY